MYSLKEGFHETKARVEFIKYMFCTTQRRVLPDLANKGEHSMIQVGNGVSLCMLIAAPSAMAESVAVAVA